MNTSITMTICMTLPLIVLRPEFASAQQVDEPVEAVNRALDDGPTAIPSEAACESGARRSSAAAR